MAKHVITQDRHDTVMINTTNDLWVINQDVTIAVTGEYGILESGGGNTIKVLGDIKASGDGFAGIRFQGSDSEVEIDVKSVINAVDTDSGIQYDGAGGHINIDGVVKGGEQAIHGNIWAVVQNHGTLSGDAGVAFDGDGSDITNFKTIDAVGAGIASGAAGTLIDNKAGASIVADSTGILLTGMTGDQSAISNEGTIKADIAIEDGDDSVTLTNSGKIIGEVILGAGNDTFDTRKGTVTGQIQGNDGDDTFIVSQSSLKISEETNGGLDTVRSTVDYHLNGGVEILALIGGKDIDGTGTKFGNVIVGNKGDNHLVGLNGFDILGGGKGDDSLEGDLGKDTFIFNGGDGKDRVVDFQNGVDGLHSDLVLSQQDFDALTINQQGADTVINFGNGDTLTLEHFTKGDLDFGDFIV